MRNTENHKWYVLPNYKFCFKDKLIHKMFVNSEIAQTFSGTIDILSID